MEIDIKPMTRLIDALSARTHFGEVMEKAEKNKVRFLVSRRGKPMVVILGVEDYLKNVLKEPELLTKIQVTAQRAGLDQLDGEEIEAEIVEYRKADK